MCWLHGKCLYSLRNEHFFLMLCRPLKNFPGTTASLWFPLTDAPPHLSSAAGQKWSLSIKRLFTEKPGNCRGDTGE